MHVNYHTHTFRCKHAIGDVIDYAKEADQRNISILGITDHTPLPDNRWSFMRMGLDELDDYEKAIEHAAKTYPTLQILKGMECDYDLAYLNFYKEELLGKRTFDYLICGVHFYQNHGEWIDMQRGTVDKRSLWAYTDFLIEAMKSSLFSFIAHPDGFASTYLNWDDEAKSCAKAIFEASIETSTALEINGLGMRKPKVLDSTSFRYGYPFPPFWELAAEYDIQIVINSDAHRPQDVNRNIAEGFLVAKQAGLLDTNMFSYDTYAV